MAHQSPAKVYLLLERNFSGGMLRIELRNEFGQVDLDADRTGGLVQSD